MCLESTFVIIRNYTFNVILNHSCQEDSRAVLSAAHTSLCKCSLACWFSFIVANIANKEIFSNKS